MTFAVFPADASGSCINVETAFVETPVCDESSGGKMCGRCRLDQRAHNRCRRDRQRDETSTRGVRDGTPERVIFTTLRLGGIPAAKVVGGLNSTKISHGLKVTEESR